MEPFRKTEIHVLAMNQILREGLGEQSRTEFHAATEAFYPNLLAKEGQPGRDGKKSRGETHHRWRIRVVLTNRDGNAFENGGSGKKGSRIGWVRVKRMEVSVGEQWKVSSQQQRRGNLLLTINFSLWSEVASEKFRVGEGEQARGSQLGKGEEF
jgi:hypothetical protein